MSAFTVLEYCLFIDLASIMLAHPNVLACRSRFKHRNDPTETPRPAIVLCSGYSEPHHCIQALAVPTFGCISYTRLRKGL